MKWVYILQKENNLKYSTLKKKNLNVYIPNFSYLEYENISEIQ